MATEKKAKKVTEEVKDEKVVDAPVEEKASKKKAKKEAPEAPKKPMPTSAKATATNVRVTPRKARLVLDLIRGKDLKVALGILANTNKAATAPITKVVKSAAANAINNFGMDEGSLYIAECYATDGLKMRRYLPRAKGSASGLVKRASHITVVVKMR